MVITSALSTSNAIVIMVFTSALILALMIQAFLTKQEVTLKNASLYILGAAIASSFFMTIVFLESLLTIILCALFTTAIGFYLVFHVQSVVKDDRYELGPKDYIIASMLPYIDIIVLFLLALEYLIGGSKK